MKKTVLVIGLFVTLLTSLSAHTDREVKPFEGFKAPMVTLTDAMGRSLVLGQSSESGAIVHFWRSCDVTSRLEAIRLDRMAASGCPQQVILVNMDEDEGLYNKIQTADRLTNSHTFHIRGNQAREVAEVYNLTDRDGRVLEMKTYHISPVGTITAVDPA